MENIEKALNLASQINHTNSNELVEAAEKIVPEALKELQALKKAGISVHRVETYTIEKPAARRRSKQPTAAHKI